MSSQSIAETVSLPPCTICKYRPANPDDGQLCDACFLHYQDHGDEACAGCPPRTAAALAAELGRVRYERDLLLHQIQVLEADIGAARGPTAWRTLLAVARFVEDGSTP